MYEPTVRCDVTRCDHTLTFSAEVSSVYTTHNSDRLYKRSRSSLYNTLNICEHVSGTPVIRVS